MSCNCGKKSCTKCSTRCIRGPQGPKGDRGLTGPVGPTGPAGSTPSGEITAGGLSQVIADTDGLTIVSGCTVSLAAGTYIITGEISYKINTDALEGHYGIYANAALQNTIFPIGRANGVGSPEIVYNDPVCGRLVLGSTQTVDFRMQVTDNPHNLTVLRYSLMYIKTA